MDNVLRLNKTFASDKLDALNRLSRKLESSENMQQSDDYKHDGFS